MLFLEAGLTGSGAWVEMIISFFFERTQTNLLGSLASTEPSENLSRAAARPLQTVNGPVVIDRATRCLSVDDGPLFSVALQPC